MNYEQKYLKYKQKYLQLKLQLEGGLSLNPWRYKKRESKGTESADLQCVCTCTIQPCRASCSPTKVV